MLEEQERKMLEYKKGLEQDRALRLGLVKDKKSKKRKHSSKDKDKKRKSSKDKKASGDGVMVGSAGLCVHGAVLELLTRADEG